jgi:hypothetical protein
LARANDERFVLEHVFGSLKSGRFEWHRFQEIFPFGFLGIREGEYAKLVEAAALSLPTKKERVLLIDMLDMQWIAYLEQLWAANEFGDNHERFAGECHFAGARLQINDNGRINLEIQPRGIRTKLLKNSDENSTNLGIFVAGLTGSKDHCATHPWFDWMSDD